MTTGTFIISLDCEGKWGMADHLNDWHHSHLNRTELVDAYRRLIALFERYDTPASFAFVMGFLLSPKEQAELADHFVDTSIEGKNWLAAFREAQSGRALEGWSCPELLDVVQFADQHHEIACHGFTHLPLSANLVNRQSVSRELAAANEVAKRRGLTLETLVFPRNLVGHTDAVEEAGFAGYRAKPPMRGKIEALAAECNPLDKAQAYLPNDGALTVIPSGEMLNWQSGKRKIIPRSASRARWQSRLVDAAGNGKVAHIWLHPHNIIDAPGTFERLEDVLAMAAELREQGRLRIVTQARFCASDHN